MQGAADLVRFADDAVFSFSNENDARRVLDVLAKSLILPIISKKEGIVALSKALII